MFLSLTIIWLKQLITTPHPTPKNWSFPRNFTLWEGKVTIWGRKRSCLPERDLKIQATCQYTLEEETEAQRSIVGGITSSWDCLNVHILSPVYKLQPYFRTPVMDSGNSLDPFVPLSHLGTTNKAIFLYFFTINLTTLVGFLRMDGWTWLLWF